MTASSEWSSKLEGAVKSLFYLFLALELVVIAMKGLIQKSSLEDIFSNLIMSGAVSGIILFFIMNYNDFSRAIMGGLANYTDLMGYNSKDIVTDPLNKGFEFFNNFIVAMKDWGYVATAIGLIVGFVILVIFALITIQIIYIKCETFVAVGASFILMGFGAFSMTRDYMMSLLRYVISVGFKLYILYVVLGLGFSFLDQLIVMNSGLSFSDIAVILITVLIIYVLTKSLPDVASGIINGAHVSTGNALASSMKTVALTTIAAVVAAGKGAKSGNEKRQNFKEARNQARENGDGMLQGIKNYYKASRDAKNEANPTHNHRMRSKLEAMRERTKNGQ